MHHLKLIMGASYRGAVHATKDHPDVYVEDGPAYAAAMKSGYFEEVDDAPEDGAAEGGDPASATLDPEETNPEETESDGLEDMSVSDLKAYAQLNGIDISGAKKKEDILKVIREAEAHAAEVRSALRGE